MASQAPSRPAAHEGMGSPELVAEAGFGGSTVVPRDAVVCVAFVRVHGDHPGSGGGTRSRAPRVGGDWVIADHGSGSCVAQGQPNTGTIRHTTMRRRSFPPRDRSSNISVKVAIALRGVARGGFFFGYHISPCGAGSVGYPRSRTPPPTALGFRGF